MLTGCRELAGRRMATALSGMLDRVEDDLFELAEKAPDREMQNVYLDARAQAREKRALIEAAFGRHFIEFFNRKVRGDVEPPTPEQQTGELSLMGDEDLEDRIAVREMSRKLQSACEGELMALSARMGFLLEKPELADDANPLSPSTICAALKDACDHIQADFKVRMALLRQFETYAQDALQGVYHEMNSHLVGLRVLPEVRPGIRRVPPTPASPRKAAAPAASAARSGAAATRNSRPPMAIFWEPLHSCWEAACPRVPPAPPPVAPRPARLPARGPRLRRGAAPAVAHRARRRRPRPPRCRRRSSPSSRACIASREKAIATSEEALMNVVRRIKAPRRRALRWAPSTR